MTRGDEADTVRFLAQIANGGRALEFASGTGRIAVPLAAEGVTVEGVELSDAMTKRLHLRPGGEEVPVTTGDMATVRVAGTYDLVYLVFNSLFNLLTQAKQVRCFENARRHLKPGGAFVVEAFNPSHLHRLDDHQYVKARGIEMDSVQVDVVLHDPVAQTTEGNHMKVSSSGIEMNPIVLRYAWPSELDLMAHIAGLTLEQRWAGWRQEPFESRSDRHISVYRNAR